MKICPTCDESFSDDDLNFCLMDGTPLVAGESQPTVAIRGSGAATAVMPRSPETASVSRKNSSTIWIFLAVSSLALMVVTVVAGGFLFYFYTASDENAVGSRKGTLPAPTTPRVAATPRSVTSPANSPAAEPSPSSAATNADPDVDEFDGITPIAWDTAAFLFTGDDGKVYEFECPENGTASAVWGNAAYTEDSSICTAAVHSGVITLEDGGYVVIQFRPGRETYGSSTRNGITTLSFGQADRSFVIGKKVSGH